MIKCNTKDSYNYIGDLIEITEACGQEVDHIEVEGWKRASYVFLSDDKRAYILYYPIDTKNYHMHIMSQDGGRQVTKLMRDTCVYLLEECGVQAILGFVSNRGERLMIGQTSRILPVTVVKSSGEAVYIITREHLGKLKEVR